MSGDRLEAADVGLMLTANWGAPERDPQSLRLSRLGYARLLERLPDRCLWGTTVEGARALSQARHRLAGTV